MSEGFSLLPGGGALLRWLLHLGCYRDPSRQKPGGASFTHLVQAILGHLALSIVPLRPHWPPGNRVWQALAGPLEKPMTAQCHPLRTPPPPTKAYGKPSLSSPVPVPAAGLLASRKLESKVL